MYDVSKKHIHDNKNKRKSFLFIVGTYFCCFNTAVSPCNATPLSKGFTTHVDHSSPNRSLLYATKYKTVHPWLELLPMYKGELMHNTNEVKHWIFITYLDKKRWWTNTGMDMKKEEKILTLISDKLNHKRCKLCMYYRQLINQSISSFIEQTTPSIFPSYCSASHVIIGLLRLDFFFWGGGGTAYPTEWK